MQKEKKIRTYQRRTKSGKTVTVRAHTAKYDAADKAKEMATKKGAGKELEDRKKKNEEVQLEIPFDWKDKIEKEKEKVEEMAEKGKSKPAESKKKTTDSGKRTIGRSPKEKLIYSSDYNVYKKGSDGELKKVGKWDGKTHEIIKETKAASKKTVAKSSEPAFTAAEFKEWYRGTGSDADKKVAKALRAQLGRSGYRKFEDEAIDNYSSRGHLAMFKRVSGGSASEGKTSKSKDEKAKAKGTILASGAKLNEDGTFVSEKDYKKSLAYRKRKGARISPEEVKAIKMYEKSSKNSASSDGKSVNPKNLTNEQLISQMKKSGKYVFKKNGEIWYKHNGKADFPTSVDAYRRILADDYKEKASSKNLKKYAKEYGFTEKDIPKLSILGGKPKRKMSEVSSRAARNYARFEDIPLRQAKLELMMVSNKEHNEWDKFKEE